MVMGHAWKALRDYGPTVRFRLLPLPTESSKMQKSTFEILRKNGQTFISQEDLVKYLMDELTYTISNAADSTVSRDFTDGVSFTLTSLANSVGSIGK